MMNEAREQIRRTLRENDRAYEAMGIREVSAEDDYHLPRPLKVGDKVYLVALGREGEVTALADKSGKYAVSSGILRTKVEEREIRLIEGDQRFRTQASARPSEGKVKTSTVSSFRTEVDVRGMIGDDAWFVVDKYLDDAILAGISSVRIIHGKGTGALRAALWRYFKSDKRVKEFHHAPYGEGDAGVTVVELAKK